MLSQDCKIVIRHLRTLQSEAITLAPHTVITITLTTCPLLYFTSPWLFHNWQCVLLNLVTFLTHPPISPPIWQLQICSLNLLLCFCFTYLFSFLDSTHK